MFIVQHAGKDEVRLHGCLPDVGLNANAHQPYQLNIV